jgi:hypothetical protein
VLARPFARRRVGIPVQAQLLDRQRLEEIETALGSTHAEQLALFLRSEPEK